MVRPSSLVLSAAGVAGLAYGAREIRSAFLRAAAEKEGFRIAAESSERRNKQLSALYNVFSEITETLSIRYVIAATLRETLRLMEAQGAVIWLLKDNELTPGGSLTSAGKEVRGLQPQALGDGLAGRIAKRGRTLRIDDRNQDNLTQAQQAQGVRSGIMVPLIVGARVVGLLTCWSTKSNAFADEDQRILEMMASQVATAVAAADTTEASERRAHQDALTDLPNRRQLTEDIENQPSTAGRPLVVAMADLDHFKQINDHHGHHAGDVTLQKVAAVLRTCLREGDQVYRYGGEEFVIIFAGADLAEAQFLGERLRKAVESTPFSGTDLEPISVTMSLGLAASPEHGSDLSTLIELADKAMYQAKESGRNRVTLWSDEPQTLLEAA